LESSCFWSGFSFSGRRANSIAACLGEGGLDSWIEDRKQEYFNI
jgi:hypothetical protein